MPPRYPGDRRRRWNPRIAPPETSIRRDAGLRTRAQWTGPTRLRACSLERRLCRPDILATGGGAGIRESRRQRHRSGVTPGSALALSGPDQLACGRVHSNGAYAAQISWRQEAALESANRAARDIDQA